MPYGKLFPAIEPYATGMLALDGRHVMYWEQSGNPQGLAVVFLHGGPGAGATPQHRRFFDPRRYRIIIFEQRGAGRSTPLGELTDNTTPHLVADMERLRVHLGIESWLVFGGSWGSTLALAYGEAHPERCLGFILRGVFLCRAREIDWFVHGMGTLFPEAWRRFRDFLPEGERGDLLANYYRRLADPDPAVHMAAAQSWAGYEGACSTLRPSPDMAGVYARSPNTLSLARLEAHYLSHGGFLSDNQLLDHIGRIAHLPCAIVQGRYDAVCPIVTADAVVQAWPGVEYDVVMAGHSAAEPATAAGLVKAARHFADRLGAPR